MPSLTGVIETSLYVDDLDRASQFYEELFDLQRIAGDARIRAYDVGGRSVLLLFRPGASKKASELPGGVIVPHDGSGELHLAFSIRTEELGEWERSLETRGIAVEQRIHWPRGGTSLYFRDPDDNSVELATPGVWSIY